MAYLNVMHAGYSAVYMLLAFKDHMEYELLLCVS